MPLKQCTELTMLTMLTKLCCIGTEQQMSVKLFSSEQEKNKTIQKIILYNNIVLVIFLFTMNKKYLKNKMNT